MGTIGTGVMRRGTGMDRWVRVIVSMGVIRRAARRRTVSVMQTGTGIRASIGATGITGSTATIRRRDTVR